MDALKNQKWEQINFNKIPKTKYTFKEDHLLIKVKKSNSPYILSFEEKVFKKIQFKLSINRLLKTSDKKRNQIVDDFQFKIGFIIPGNRKLSFFEKMIAPSWVIQLEKLSKDYGIEKIIFFNLV